MKEMKTLTIGDTTYEIVDEQARTELEDIRTGIDGTVYETAGDAVRAQGVKITVETFEEETQAVAVASEDVPTVVSATGATVTNYITNGNFASAEGWEVVYGGTLTIADGVASVYNDGLSVNNGVKQNISGGDRGAVAGDIWFLKSTIVSADSRIDASGGESAPLVQIYLSYGDNIGYAVRELGTIGTDITNVDKYGIVTLPFSVEHFDFYARVNYVSAENAAGKTAVLDNIVAVNLTEAYGAGNEPTSDEFYALLSTLDGAYFDGTVTLDGTSGDAGGDSGDSGDDSGGSSGGNTDVVSQSGYKLSITTQKGTETLYLYQGQQGNDGKNGADGTDGFSPTITVEAIENGNRLTITDTNGTQSVDILNGDPDAIEAVQNDIEEIKAWGVISKNLYNPENDTFGVRADGSGNSNSTNARNSEWITVEPNSNYVLSNNTTGTFAIIIVFKENDNIVTVEDAYTIGSGGSYLLTTNENTTHIRFSTYSSSSNDYMAEGFMLEKGTKHTEYEPYKVILDYQNRLPEPMQNPWMGKKMVVDGDSITHDWEGTYWQFVASKILGMYLDTSIKSADDYPTDGVYGCGWRGIGGSTIADETQAKINAGQTTDEEPLARSILLRYQNLPDDADIVLIAGGSNDWAHSAIELGETDSADITTFNGALNALLPSLKAKYPTIPVVMMTPIKRGTVHNSTNNKGLTLQQFADAMITKCREYGVYCLDMWGTCPINPQIPVMLDMFFRTDDDTHPNNDGHAVMGKTVAGFIRTLT